jgi:hypothetical protein
MRAMIAAAALAGLAGAVGAAGAQPVDVSVARDQARALALEGIELLRQGKHAEALVKLGAAEAAFHAPPHLVYMARAHQGLGALAEAHELYVRVLLEELPAYAPEAFHRARADAAQEEIALRARLPTALVRVTGADGPFVLTLGDRPLDAARAAYPVAVTAGVHTVTVVTRGRTLRRQLAAAEGRMERVDIDLSPAPAAPCPPPPAAEPAENRLLVPAVVSAGVGGAALVAGAVTGAVTLRRAGEIEGSCPGGVCPRAREEEVSDAKALGTASTILFIAGGLGVAAGVTLLVVGASAEPEASAAVFELAPTGPRLSLRW